MLTQNAYGDSRLSLWLRVREYAVPPSMIETATVRRRAGDWAGACAAAGVDADLDLRALARTHGARLAARVRADLRQLAPDLLRWHMPRVAPDGLLRPGLTIALARYQDDGRSVHLVVRTPPAWADAGQRISLALWDGTPAAAGAHPHPRPHRRFRLDLHRHLWDARRAAELRTRSGADRPPADGPPPADPRWAVDRWSAEAEIVLRAEGRRGGTVLVRLGTRDRTLVHVADPAATGDGSAHRLPVLPDAATWVLPDLELLRAGALTAGRLHPLVAAALVPGHAPSASRRLPDPAGRPPMVECRGARHRIGQVDGVLVPLDHGQDEIRREELLAALTGTPLPCLQAIDEAHRRPDCLPGVRERLDHGDTAGALAVVEGLLGPEAVLRDGPLRDALETAAERRIAHGLFRAGLADPGPRRAPDQRRPRDRRSRPRAATFR
ncbi:hypothetical protein ACIP98_18860 [Streptomyces sp. NPDC088354]|uniref:hypothetical protein n=1 Tax=Streptomyces sp. NPDC088354 TaxID=3365856 RepID=UPI0037F7AD1C